MVHVRLIKLLLDVRDSSGFIIAARARGGFTRTVFFENPINPASVGAAAAPRRLQIARIGGHGGNVMLLSAAEVRIRPVFIGHRQRLRPITAFLRHSEMTAVGHDDRASSRTAVVTIPDVRGFNAVGGRDLRDLAGGRIGSSTTGARRGNEQVARARVSEFVDELADFMLAVARELPPVRRRHLESDFALLDLNRVAISYQEAALPGKLAFLFCVGLASCEQNSGQNHRTNAPRLYKADFT